MDRKFTVAIDMDGVMYPFDEVFIKLYVAHGGEPFEFDRWISFDNDLDPEIVSRVWKDERLFKIGKPYSGVSETIDAFDRHLEINPYVVTSVGRRPQLTVPHKWQWLRQYTPQLDWKRLVILRDKWLFAADAFIDDFSQNVIKWRKRRGGHAFLIRRPWNRDLTDEKAEELGIHVVGSLAETFLPISTIIWKERGVK